MTKAVPPAARELAAQIGRLFDDDAELARRLNDAQDRLRRANERLWWGIHPDGLAAIYGEQWPADSARTDVAFAESRSEVLAAADPLRAAQEAHWAIHRAFLDYQAAAEDRRHLAVDVGELVRAFVDALTAAGWSEEDARNADVRVIAAG